MCGRLAFRNTSAPRIGNGGASPGAPPARQIGQDGRGHHGIVTGPLGATQEHPSSFATSHPDCPHPMVHLNALGTRKWPMGMDLCHSCTQLTALCVRPAWLPFSGPKRIGRRWRRPGGERSRNVPTSAAPGSIEHDPRRRAVAVCTIHVARRSPAGEAGAEPLLVILVEKRPALY